MQPLRLGSPAQLCLLLAIAIGLAIVPFARALGELYSAWNLQPEYSHGVLVPVLSAYLIWRQREELRGLPFKGSWSGLALVALGLVLRVLGEMSTMRTIEHYAFLLVIYGLVLALTGPVVFRRLWMPLLILLFALPLPSFLTNALSVQLQLISSAIGVGFIRAAGISVLLQGNIIDLGNYQLEVAEACSGLRYLFPLMTLAFIVAYLFRGPRWKKALVFLSSIPITVLMNSLRIGFIGITVDRWGPAMAEGALHEFEGWLMFMVSTGALILVAFGLARVGPSRTSWSETFSLTIPPRTLASSNTPQAQPAGNPRGVPYPFVAAIILVCMGAAAGFAKPVIGHSSAPARADFSEFPTRIGDWVGQRQALEKIYLDALQLDDYVLSDYHDSVGSVVNFYAAYYQTQEVTRSVHSPHDCIPGGGWEIQQFGQRSFPAAGTGSFLVNRAVVQMGSTRQIVYYWFQERGRHLTGDSVVRWYLFWDALTRHRTDGALVRFVAPLPPGASESEVDARIMRLATLIQPTLNRYIPD